MVRFIELTPVETGVAQLFNVEHFIEVRPTNGGGSEILKRGDIRRLKSEVRQKRVLREQKKFLISSILLYIEKKGRMILNMLPLLILIRLDSKVTMKLKL